MKKFILFIAVTISVTVKAQVSAVSLQASGLTCSMCSNSVNKALQAVDFVREVDADIRTYTYLISFKPNSVIDFDMLRKSVENAGFTVCSFVVTIHFDSVRVNNSDPVAIQNKILLFPQSTDRLLNGDIRVAILDKGFVSAKEYKKNAFLISSPHSYHVTIH
jgi:copper chaperone CopZ